jgi:thiosulfate/3-mercaptopyruvate sulfurtransferase
LDGGIRDWVRRGHPTDKETAAIQPRVFRPRLGNSLWVDAETVSRSLDNPSFLLVDARAVNRFQGLEEPLDSIAGHVPGALNRPFQNNLGADGRFRKAEDLRSEWTSLTGPRPAREVVHMCGSGVTACHNILAMEVAGLSGACLYPGSWSEWIRDPERPVVNES